MPQKSENIINSLRPIIKKEIFSMLMLAIAKTAKPMALNTIIIVAYVYHPLRST